MGRTHQYHPSTPKLQAPGSRECNQNQSVLKMFGRPQNCYAREEKRAYLTAIKIKRGEEEESAGRR